MTEKNDTQPTDPTNDDYIGNMWGWKFSIFSLGLILLTLGVLIYRGEDAFEDAKQENLLEIKTQHHERIDTLK